MYLGKISSVSVNISRSSSFLLAAPPYQPNRIMLGAAFINSSVGGQIIDTLTGSSLLNSNISAAAVISSEYLMGVTSLNVLIIDQPSSFVNVDQVTNKILVSPMVFVTARRYFYLDKTIPVSLFFTDLQQFKPPGSGTLYCSFFDTTTSSWNNAGCTSPIRNNIYNRYECSCNHLTSFALVWLPESASPDFNAQDIASIIFELVSIICFLAVLIHAMVMRYRNRSDSTRIYDLLPLISMASSTILFIFYIALTLTVYRNLNSYEGKTQCFLSAKVLMFLVYFFLIMMFCVKSSVGYFNYLRFVRLFPEPKAKTLWLFIIISFLVSFIWFIFAVGFDSNASLNITLLYGSKLCWFNRNVIYYFLLIPVVIFGCITIVTIVLVGRNLIKHVNSAATDRIRYQRLKTSVIILLFSCVTQGIAWLFGPVISLTNPEVSVAFTWIFVVLNGLEGLWTILLYIVICQLRLNQSLRDKDRKRPAAIHQPITFSTLERIGLDPSTQPTQEDHVTHNQYSVNETQYEHVSEMSMNRPYETEWIETRQQFSTLV